ncbi:glycosyltransferase involved in cell wall biosynthesis [Frigoribacterium sp. PhB160]|uniref:glycosyltransferase family 2 protein n=1 Tax=Frigoribacterium sp. PhB160 TaxID=2485192 RepID=UPI000F488AFE|nr:glycosyltransferase family 2 protein [Frigoribacterium sp. PhB160]ROS61996.1 glycosyltransferase involved in cell wall biosynthesis [Frigoribacterium sp. PhB160]
MNQSFSTPENVKPRITIVVPARNEARNLEIVLPMLPPVHEVILVDGHSVDDTVETAVRVMPDIKVVHQTRKGKGNALACGFEAATGDIIVMFDADGSADPAEIPRFVEALTDGADVAKGSRFVRGGGSEDITRFRALGNWGLNALTNLLLGTKYTDLCYGYNAFWTRIVPSLDLLPSDLPARADGQMHNGDGFEIETILNTRIAALGYDIVEVPSVEKLRIHGVSNLNAISDGFRVLRVILAERRRRPSAAERLRASIRRSAELSEAGLTTTTATATPVLASVSSTGPELSDDARGARQDVA